jgi:hypothetical protein
MKAHRIVSILVLGILLACAVGYLSAGKLKIETSAHAAEPAKAYLGRWDLTLRAPDREYPSWLEVREEGGQLKAEFVGRWGNARPLPKVELSNGNLTFVSPKAEEDLPVDMVFEGSLTVNTLSGKVNGPNGAAWQWTAERAPSLERKSTPKWGQSVALFNGKDLTGWKTSGKGKSEWKVENGILITPGEGPELINDSKFEDFKMHVEFNCGPISNSGVYLRGRYEVQIETDSADEGPLHHTGSVYGFIAPSPELPRKANQWQTYDITLLGRRVTVIQNGQTVIDNKEIPGITGGALDSHEGLPGPIYLQGSEKGHVQFRNIVITPAEK